MSDKHRKSQKTTVHVLSGVPGLICPRVSLKDDDQWKARPIQQKKFENLSSGSNPIQNSPEQNQSQDQMNEEQLLPATQSFSKLEIIKNMSHYEQLLVWTKGSIVEKELEVFNEKGESVDLLDWSQASKIADQVLHLIKQELQYWFIDTSECILVIVVPNGPILDFSSEATLLREFVLAQPKPLRNVAQSISKSFLPTIYKREVERQNEPKPELTEIKEIQNNSDEIDSIQPVTVQAKTPFDDEDQPQTDNPTEGLAQNPSEIKDVEVNGDLEIQEQAPIEKPHSQEKEKDVETTFDKVKQEQSHQMEDIKKDFEIEEGDSEEWNIQKPTKKKKTKKEYATQIAKAREFKFFDWVHDLRKDIRTGPGLLSKFDQLCVRIFKDGPWKEVERKKGKGKQDRPEMILIEESEYMNKMRDILKETLKEEVIDEQRGFKLWQPIDAYVYFKWYDLEKIKDVFQIQDEVVEIFLDNFHAKMSLIYNVDPESLCRHIHLNDGEYSYSALLGNFLTYFLATKDDALMLIEVIKYGIRNKEQKSLTNEQKNKLSSLMFDCIERFNPGLMKIPDKNLKKQEMIFDLFNVIKDCCFRTPSMIPEILEKSVDSCPKDQKYQFYYKLIEEQPHIIDIRLYEHFLKDPVLSFNQKQNIFNEIVKDKSVVHHSNFLALIKKIFHEGVHLELIVGSIEQHLFKLAEPPKEGSQERFLRYCLDRVLSSHRDILIKKCIVALHKASRVDLNEGQSVETFRLLKNKNGLIFKTYSLLLELLNNQIPSENTKIDLFEDPKALEFHEELFLKLYPDFKNQFQSSKRKIADIRNELRLMREVLNNFNYFLKDQPFFKQALQWISDLEINLKDMTLLQIKNNDNFKNLKVLKTDAWSRLPPFLNLDATNADLKKKAMESRSIMDFTEKLRDYISTTKTQFESFERPELFSYLASQYFFKRANKQACADRMRTCLLEMHINPRTVESILENAMCFAGLRKTIKLADAVVLIRDFPFMQRESTRLVEDMLTVKELFAAKTDQNFMLSEVLINDAGRRIVKDELIRRLPDCLIKISNAPNALEFIQKKEDKLIRSMRDDCGSEDTDIVNKLEAINRSLKEITLTAEIPEINNVLKKISRLTKEQRNEITSSIDEVEKATKHLEYVFEKAQKGSQFQKTQVLGIMTDSTLSIQYNIKTGKFEASAEFGESKEIVDSDEFSELFNLIKILVSNSTERPEDDPDNEHKKLINFSKLGEYLKKLLDQIEWMRNIGLINTKFTKVVDQRLSKFCRGMIRFSQDSSKLMIAFTHQTDSLGKISNLVTELSDVQKKVNASLTEDLLYFSLINLYSGRKLFYLTELLSGNIKNLDDSNQILNMITESIDLPDSDLVILRRTDNHAPVKQLLEEQLASVEGDIMRNFSNKVFENIKIKQSGVQMLSSCLDVIKLSGTRVTTKATESMGQYQTVELNEFQVIFSLLEKADQQMVSLSQLFYCGKQLNLFDLIAFLQRALRDPLQRFYFLLNADAMDDDVFSEFQKHGKSILSHRAKNKNLLVFLNDAQRRAKLEETQAFVDCGIELVNVLESVDRNHLVDKYQEAFRLTKIVTSPSAGMGKSKYISEETKSTELIDLFLTGEVNETTVMSRMTGAIDRCIGSKAKSISVCIKLDYIEDYKEHSKLVDFALFCLCFLRKVPTEKGCHIFGEQLKHIYIELGNTFMNTLLDTSMILKILCWDECVTVLRSQRIITMSEFKVKDLDYFSNGKSEDQIAMKLLSVVKNPRLKDTKIEDIPVLSKNECEDLVNQYFLTKYCRKDKTLVTYAQYKFWIKILAQLATEIEKIQELRPEQLSASQKELRFELFEESAYLASFLANFTVEQARSTQDDMKELVSSIHNKETNTIDVEKYKDRFSRLEPWDCKKFIIPMLNPEKQKFMLAVYEASKPLNDDNDELRRSKRRCTKTLFEQQKWYSENVGGKKQERHFIYARMLAKYQGDDEEELIKRVERYSLTGDNFMKIALMILKAKMKIPIIIMGESGCGKTYLTEFVANTLLGESSRKSPCIQVFQKLNYLVLSKTV
jgi:hypothetical protein